MYRSVEDLIQKQTSKVDELKQMIGLMGDKKYLTEELTIVLELVNGIRDKIDVLKLEKEEAERLVNHFEQREKDAFELEAKLIEIEENLPDIFNFNKMATTLNETAELEYVCSLRYNSQK
jgi:hypothetical protein